MSDEQKQRTDLNGIEEIKANEIVSKPNVVTDQFNNDESLTKEINCEKNVNTSDCEVKEGEDGNELQIEDEVNNESEARNEQEDSADSTSDSSSSSSSLEDTSEEERRRRRRKAKKKARKARLKLEAKPNRNLLSEEVKEQSEKKPKLDKRSKKARKSSKTEDDYKDQRSGKRSKKAKIEKTPEELEREAHLREMRRLERLAEEEKAKKHYKYGRYFLLVLALASIPFDLYKMIDAIIKAENYITTSLHDSLCFYSGTLCTHLVGFVAAIEHQLWLTIFCRFICTFVYQFEMTSKSNDTVPTDPDQLKKYADKKLFQKRGNPNKQLDPDDDVAMLLFNSEYL